MRKSSRYLRRKLAWLLGDSPVLSTTFDVGVDGADGMDGVFIAWAKAVAAPAIASETDSFFFFPLCSPEIRGIGGGYHNFHDAHF